MIPGRPLDREEKLGERDRIEETEDRIKEGGETGLNKSPQKKRYCICRSRSPSFDVYVQSLERAVKTVRNRALNSKP
jgi:hypothetical protein